MQVVIETPRLDLRPGTAERRERHLVERRVPEPAMEALDEAVLQRLAGRDAMPANRYARASDQDGHRGELGAVAADNGPRPARPSEERVEFPGPPEARQRGQALSAINGVDSARALHRNVPHWVLSC